jgi:hypothetical protein
MVSDCLKSVLTENGRLVCVVFELEQVARAILEKEPVVFDTRLVMPRARVLIEGQLVSLAISANSCQPGLKPFNVKPFGHCHVMCRKREGKDDFSHRNRP